MTYGFDALPAESACCAAKTWPERNVSAGIMLYVFGTVPDPNAISKDAHTQTLYQVRNRLLEKIEEIAEGIGANDIRYANMILLDTLNDCNLRVREIRSFLGQGIYLGGTVVYTSGKTFCAISFGGSSVFRWSDHSITRLGNVPQDQLIRNALGGREAWKPDIFLDDFTESDRGLLAISSWSVHTEFCLKQLVEGIQSKSQLVHTPSILIRHEVEKITGAPSAVMELLI